MIDEDQKEPHFRQTAAIARKTGIATAILIIAVVIAAGVFPDATIFRFPAGFFVGGLLIFLLMPVLIFWFASSQNAVDRQYGASDEF